MWPKALHFYLIDSEFNEAVDLESLPDLLETHQFTPIGSMQEQSIGWVPVFNDSDLLSESVTSSYLFKLKIQDKILPASVINEILAERLDQIEADQGRRPGRKEREQMKEDIRAELLPQAFHKTRFITGWIDPVRNILAVAASSGSSADEFSAHLREALGTLPVVPLHGWCHHDLDHWYKHPESRPEWTEVFGDLSLYLPQDTAVKAAFRSLALGAEEIEECMNNGMIIDKIRADYNGQMSFTIDLALTLKSIKWSDKLVEKAGEDDDPRTDALLMLSTVYEWLDAIGANGSLLKKQE